MARPDIDTELLLRVYRGELRRSNTQPGTPERRAVDRVTYLRRRRRHPELTARQALSHPAPMDTAPAISLMVDGPPRFIIIEGLSRGDLRRAGRYQNLVRLLSEGRMTPAEFRRRVRSWRPIAGFTFLSDPDAVLAQLDEQRAGDQDVFYYSSGRSQ